MNGTLVSSILVDRQQHALDTFLQHLVGDAEEAADLLRWELLDSFVR